MKEKKKSIDQTRLSFSSRFPPIRFRPVALRASKATEFGDVIGGGAGPGLDQWRRRTDPRPETAPNPKIPAILVPMLDIPHRRRPLRARRESRDSSDSCESLAVDAAFGGCSRDGRRRFPDSRHPRSDPSPQNKQAANIFCAKILGMFSRFSETIMRALQQKEGRGGVKKGKWVVRWVVGW